jgi:hypothetical protein
MADYGREEIEGFSSTGGKLNLQYQNAKKLSILELTLPKPGFSCLISTWINQFLQTRAFEGIDSNN